MIRPTLDHGLVAAVSAALDLRAPNRDALTTIALRVSEHFAADEPSVPYEGVIDVATGVGKTYVLAGVIEYLAEKGYRDFAIVTPGRTVARKTVRNFTPGNAKSLLPGMEVDPVVVTSETFSSPAVAAAMADPERVKVYIFTVQALLKPTTKMGPRPTISTRTSGIRSTRSSARPTLLCYWRTSTTCMAVLSSAKPSVASTRRSCSVSLPRRRKTLRSSSVTPLPPRSRSAT